MSDPTGRDTIKLDLAGVPETMLWPLWNRGAEMRRTSRLIEDPLAADLIERIDYDFRGRFGPPNPLHAVRARVCDDLVTSYLDRHRDESVVVALGEGLEGQLWRIGDRPLSWISVDVPEAVAVRRWLLPEDRRQTLVACSALDPAWIDAVPKGRAPFISAAGLLMYFQESEVRTLLARIGERFPGAEIFFDAIPPFVSRKTLRGWKITKHYSAPPMPWGITVDDLPDFIRSVPGLQVVTVQTYADPFPKRTRLYNILSRIPAIRRRFAGSLAHVRVVGGAGGNQ